MTPTTETPESRHTREKPGRMWKPPTGWLKAAHDARDQRSLAEFRREDNERRRQYGLPTYEV